MSDTEELNIAQLFEDSNQIEAALHRGVQDALRRHKLMNLPVYVMKDGKPTWLPPEEIQLDPESPNQS